MSKSSVFAADPSATKRTILFGPPRTIYIISPQPWNGFRVSKHHYAIELASLGHRVYFIDPPDVSRTRGEVTIGSTEIDGLLNVHYGPWFPYKTKFHARWVFDRAMQRQAKLLIAAIGEKPGIVWDFDNTYQFADLRTFGDCLKIFHPVDNFSPRTPADKNADVIFAVDQIFLDKISSSTPKSVIPHGLGRLHQNVAKSVLKLVNANGVSDTSRRPAVGYVGNLAHHGIDWPAIFNTIDANVSADFAFIGPFDEHASAPCELRKRPHCTLHGQRTQTQILERASGIDVWMACYDPARTIDGATNSHKILEYLATGSAVIANHMTAYTQRNLVTMPTTSSNSDFPALLARLLADLDKANALDQRKKRAAFALAHGYSSHLATIDSRLAALPALTS